MFYVGEWSSELIICFLDFSKKDFGEVDEVMFEGVVKPCEIIFGIMVIEKSDLDEVA
jgi:hypothetical protein